MRGIYLCFSCLVLDLGSTKSNILWDCCIFNLICVIVWQKHHVQAGKAQQGILQRSQNCMHVWLKIGCKGYFHGYIDT